MKSRNVRTHLFSQSGNTKAPVIIVAGALCLSAVIFFLFTKKKLQKEETVVGGAGQPSVATAPAIPGATEPSLPADLPAAGPGPAAMTAGGASAPTGSQAANPVSAVKPSNQASLGFARPADLGQNMAKALATGDYTQAALMAASGDLSQVRAAEDVFTKIFGDMGFKVAGEDQVKIMGQVGEATRVTIPLLRPGKTTSDVAIQMDLERDASMGWKVGQLRLPKELESAVAAAMTQAPSSVAGGAVPGSVNTPGGGTPAPAGNAGAAASVTGTAATSPASSTPAKGGTPLFVIEQHADALGFANGFVTALLGRDFAAARAVIDGNKVPAEKLAGLCIVFEEGSYALKPSKPLIITVASPKVSWVIAQVESETLQQSTEFGLELQRESEDAPWKVVGLNLSDLLGSFAQVASRLGVPYTPIVQNPKGGESLALYFEYDQPAIHPRGVKQLAIVADLLKSNTSRKLRITGHTDAMGADDYNVRLSQARAYSVKEQLVALGVNQDQILTEGLGKAAPLSPNQKADGSDDPEGRSRNRRAEIFLDF